MKKALLLTAMITTLFSTAIFAQTKADSSLNSQSLNGSTGLYSIPTGHVAWENKGNFGIDFGYRAIINDGAGVTHIPAITLTFIKMIEISTAFDFQPDNYYSNKDNENDDLLLGFKIKLPTAKNTSFAIGTNIHLLNIDNENHDYNAYQPYVAITYSGNFFSSPARTTVVFGKTFYSGGPENNSNVDFGMGFDLLLFPDVFKDVVHWIIDFSNFNYSDNSWPNYWFEHTDSVWRGILNTGFRINLGAIPAMNKVKFVIDIVFNDLFDAGARSFTIGTVFGFSP